MAPLSRSRLFRQNEFSSSSDSYLTTLLDLWINLFLFMSLLVVHGGVKATRICAVFFLVCASDLDQRCMPWKSLKQFLVHIARR